ncbi:hypothetical protein D9M71_461200 [compost metagenome]
MKFPCKLPQPDTGKDTHYNHTSVPHVRRHYFIAAILVVSRNIYHNAVHTGCTLKQAGNLNITRIKLTIFRYPDGFDVFDFSVRKFKREGEASFS